MKKIYKIKVENKTYEVEVEEVKEVAGSVQSSAPVATAPQPVASTGGASSSITAPMPGAIIDVKVNVGDNVAKGQVVAILEAMKMETEILSDVDGKVTDVKATKGANVNLNDVILTIN